MADPVKVVQEQEVPAQDVYVGPRPFERSERGLFFGRDRESSELLSLVISSRVVLCYAPSGAGKTSLINAGLLPRLEEEGFEVLPSARVRGLIPEGIDEGTIPNLYAFHALLSLAGERKAPGEPVGRTLPEYLSIRPHLNDEDDFPEPRVLVFDQFEELITSYPERWQEREGFFQQVRDALEADPLLRVLFIFREDFLARIEPYARQLKPFSQARFRLPLLGPAGAHAAVTGPLHKTGKLFKEGVVDELVRELLEVRVETAQGEAIEVEGEYVEPVQLQVVCRNLWTSLPPNVQEISSEHVKAYGSVDKALEDFYESCLAEAKASQGAKESTLRQWFEEQLVTPAGTRGIVFRGTRLTAGLPNPTVDFLENRHLIRGEWRAGSRWYELTHDRFIEPIQDANQRWRDQRRARRARWVIGAIASLLVMLVVFSVALAARPTASQNAVVATDAVNTAIADFAVTSTAALAVVQAEAQDASKEAARSRSGQLAAQALLVDDPDLALLLAVEANKQIDTLEGRRSLHRVLSIQAVTVLDQFRPEVISPVINTKLEGHAGAVLGVSFSPDGKRLATANADSTIILWDVATRKLVGTPLREHASNDFSAVNVFSVVYSPNGTLLASAGMDGQILLRFASDGQVIASLNGHRGLVTSVAFSPDGYLLASGGQDGTVRIWDITTGEAVASFESHMAGVWAVAWSPDGTFLASAGADTVRLWDPYNNKEIVVLEGHRSLVRTLAWSPDGSLLASGGMLEEGGRSRGEVILWDPFTGQEIARPLWEYNWPVRALAFDPTGSILAIGQDDGLITLWDTRTRQALGDPLKGHLDRVMSIAFSPDGRTMASGSNDETVILWDFFAHTRSIAFSPDRRYIVSGSEDKTVRVWDANTGDEISNMNHAGIVTAVAFSPDGYYIASGSEDKTVRVWDTNTGDEISHMSHDGIVTSIAFSPDGRYIVSGSEDKTVRVWDAFGQKEIARMSHDGMVTAVDFSPDGRYIVSGCEDKTVRVWDASTGNQISSMSHDGMVTAVAFSPDGKYVLSGSSDRTARVWEVRSGKEIARMSYDNVVLSVTFSPDGNYVALGSRDAPVSIWEAATGAKVTELLVPSVTITGLDFGLDGKTLSIGTENGSVLTWGLALLDPGTELQPYLELACLQAKRSFTDSEWQQYFGNEAVSFTCSCDPDPNEVTIFKDVDYQGACQKLSIGSYDFLDTPVLPNDSASSIQLGKNIQAHLCSDAYYSGNCEDIEANVPYLGDLVIGNDSLSSIIVREKP